jgi:two-component system, OmpR family, phosphate regulon sensor histidine kinase PhoR
VKFTTEGGKVEVKVGTEEGRAMLAVTDTGIGIPVADLDRIFERFARTALATQQVIPGTGLGLTIAKAIAEAHDGVITVDSEEGRGSTFKVLLPLQPVPGREAPAGGAPGPGAAAGAGAAAGPGAGLAPGTASGARRPVTGAR